MFRTLLLAAALALPASVSSAALLTPGYDAALLSPETVGVRYRGRNSGGEHFLGINDLGVGANRTEANYTWVNGTIDFAFSYDSATGTISSTLDGQTLTYAGTAGLVSDALQLTLSNRSRQSAVFSISNLTVNGEALPDLACGFWCDWMVTEYQIQETLSVTGTITFSGVMPGNDAERVKFQITSSAVSPIPVPPALAAALLGLGGLGLYRRRQRRAA